MTDYNASSERVSRLAIEADSNAFRTRRTGTSRAPRRTECCLAKDRSHPKSDPQSFTNFYDIQESELKPGPNGLSKAPSPRSSTSQVKVEVKDAVSAAYGLEIV